MAEVQKQGRPQDQQPDQWQQDLNPQPMAGRNYGLEGTNPEKSAPTAYDLKELHEHLPDYTDDELKQIPILAPGSRLKQGSTYINLRDPGRQEFTATGDITAGEQDWFVPKTEVSYPLWNRLIGVQDPKRLDEASRP